MIFVAVTGTLAVNVKLSAPSVAVSFTPGKGATYDTKKKSFVYRGRAVCPDQSNLVLSITSGSGKNKKTVILADDDYVILNYESNLNKGTARMTIRGNSEKCKGIKVVSYKIISKGTCTYEYDDRKGTYDVKFTNGDRVYDCEVLAPTGKIIEYEWKVNGY